MFHARVLALILSAGAMMPALHAGAILQLYTERVRGAGDGATMPPIGYYNPSDPTLVHNTQTVGTPWTQGSRDVEKVSNSALYQSDTSVNRAKVVSTCPNGFCASDPDAAGDSIARASGHADAQNLRVGGYAYAANIGAASGALATSHSTVTTNFRVTSGASGLADGSIVDLNWLYHLEGSSSVSGRTYPNLSGAIANVNSIASIKTLYSEGEGDNVLAGVRFGLDLSLTNLVPGSDDVTGLISGRQLWSAYSNTGFDQSALHDYYDTRQGDQPFGLDVSVDSATGIFGLAYVPFQAKVGEWLNITLDLHLFSSAGNGAGPFSPLKYGSAFNDYFNTLKSSFEIGGASQGLGLQLEFEQPAAATETPEPGTWLAGMGLTVIGLAVRRRTRNS
ncbi:MAG: hypothetical protein JWP63_2954 [Candidatus Solibacter sp.]|jgi:hypothetical protein|nr:hypothetical protein [Candidatus Solibacter sp.]